MKTAAETLTKFRTLEHARKAAEQRKTEKALVQCFKLHRGDDGRLMR
jgi:hypothetical protein